MLGQIIPCVCCASHISIIQRPTKGLRVFFESHRLIAPRVCPPALLYSQASICQYYPTRLSSWSVRYRESYFGCQKRL